MPDNDYVAETLKEIKADVKDVKADLRAGFNEVYTRIASNRETLIRHDERIGSLEKSRDRLSYILTGLSLATFGTLVKVAFDLIMR